MNTKTSAQTPADAANAKKMLRHRAEASYRQSAPASESFDGVSSGTVQALINELRVHQIELEMQNEELLRARDESDLSRARYVDLYDLAPVGYCSVSKAGIILQANLTLAALLGVVRPALVNQLLSQHIILEDQDVYYQLKRLLAPTSAADVGSCEVRMARPDGTVFWAELQACVMLDAELAPVLRVVLTDISERKRTQAALQAAHEAQAALLHEVHHRVKNNLQIINSLLRLEARRFDPGEARAVLDEMQGRIRAMALLHESLYRTGTLASVEMGGYLKELAGQVFRAQAVGSGAVRLQLALEPIHIGMDQAMPCGLLVNELIANSLKHGFAGGRSGEVSIVLQLLPETQPGKLLVSLCVSDTGVGLGPDFEATQTSSLGMQLVGDLSRQLGGTLEVGPLGGPGAVFTVVFEVDQSKLPK